jgi:hypothetical protein
MSLFDISVLEDIASIAHPTSAQSAQLRVVLSHSSTLAAFQQSIDRAVSIRKAHLDETAASAPIDDTDDLSQSIRKIVCAPIVGWRMSNRPYFISVEEALSEGNVDLPALPGLYANLQTGLDLIADENSDHGQIPALIGSFLATSGTSWGFITSAVVNAAAGDKTSGTMSYDESIGRVTISNANSSSSLLAIRNIYETMDGATLATITYMEDGWAAGYAGSSVSLPGASNSIDMQYAVGYVLGALQKIFASYEAGTLSKLSSTTTPAPSLISDIARQWKAVRDWYDGELSTYVGSQLDFCGDTLDSYFNSL